MHVHFEKIGCIYDHINSHISLCTVSIQLPLNGHFSTLMAVSARNDDYFCK